MSNIDNDNDIMPQENTTMSDLRTLFATIARNLKSTLIDRDDAVDAAMAAILTGQHLFMLGPPGTAKSMLVKKISEHFEDARYFHRLISKTTKPVDIFGPMDLPELEKGNLRYRTSGFLPEAHFALLDELWNGNSASLNQLLTILNERWFMNGDVVERVPLRTVFSASNQTPADVSLGALYDRFAIRVFVGPITDDQKFEQLLDLPASSGPALKMSLDKIDAAIDEVAAIPLSDAFKRNVITIRASLNADPDYSDIYVSDRRWLSACKIVRAYVYLRGRDEVTGDDVRFLTPCLWSETAQIAKLDSLLLGMCSTDVQDSAFILQSAAETWSRVNLMTDEVPLLTNHSATLQDIMTMNAGHKGPECQRALRHVRGLNARIKQTIAEKLRVDQSDLDALDDLSF